jgi:hypothetical protein
MILTQSQPATGVFEPLTPRPPHFSYRFIGVLGTRDVRLAAFARDGEVITVREGETIDAQFVLQSIGIESVNVQPVGFDASSTFTLRP